MIAKLYKIGDVSKQLDLPASTIRYWESQFRQLRPVKSSGGQRFYNEKHIEILTQLKDMLHSERYTIEGAKQRIKELYSKKDSIEVASEDERPEISSNSINKEEIKKELEDILQLLQ